MTVEAPPIQPHNFPFTMRRKLPVPNNFRETKVTFRTIRTSEEFIEYLYTLKADDCLAIDLETTGFDPYRQKITVVGISVNGHNVVLVIGEALNPANPCWALFNSIMENAEVRKVFHNAKFDMKWLMQTYGARFRNADCTYIMRRLLICGLTDRGQPLLADLKTCAKEYLSYDMDKEERGNFVGNDVLTDDMLKYAAMDVAATWHLWPILDAYLDIEELRLCYDLIEKPCIPVVAAMELRGVKVNLDYLRALQGILGPRAEEFERDLNSRLKTLKVLPIIERKLSRTELASGEWGDATHIRERKPLNVNAPAQVVGVLQRLGLTVESSRKDVLDDPDYTDESLEAAALSISEQTGMDLSSDDVLDLAKDTIRRLKALRAATKALGTYIIPLQKEYTPEKLKWLDTPAPPGKKKPKLAPEFQSYIHPVTGAIHPTFGQMATDTGRFSCSDPNLQNQITDENMALVTGMLCKCLADIEACNQTLFKQEEKLKKLMGDLEDKGSVFVPGDWSLRKAYQPRPGHIYITRDYSSCELRILAEITGDPGLISNMNQDEVDPHIWNASLMYGVPHTEIGKKDPRRRAAKNGIYGKVYGIGPKKLARTLKVSFDEAKRVLKTFAKALPYLEKWCNTRAAMAVNKLYSISMSGRRRYYAPPRSEGEKAGIERQGVNMPIQATNADITKLAMVLVAEAIEPYNAHIVLSIHDELVIECPIEHAEVVNQLVEDKMLEAEGQFLSVVECKTEGGYGAYWGH